MDTMNIAIPESMKEFVQVQVARGGFSSVSEYIRALIRTDQRQQAKDALEAEILKGLESGPSSPMTAEDWQQLRRGVHDRYAKRKEEEARAAGPRRRRK